MFLAIRELKHAKLRYLLIGSIMMLIALLVLFVSGLAKGLSSDNAASIQNLKADYLVVQKDAEGRINRSMLSADTIHEIQKHESTKKMTPLGVQMSTITKVNAEKQIDVTFFAVDANRNLNPTVVEGKKLDNRTTQNVVVNESLKENGFHLGDQLQIKGTNKAFTIIGFTKKQSFSHTPVIHINKREWAEIQPSELKNQFNALAFSGSKSSAAKFEDSLSGVELVTKNDALKGIPGYKEEQGSLVMMIIFLFVIATFVLAVFFYVITIQKSNQFGVLKAIGATSGYLTRSILTQMLFLTVVSLLLAIVIAYGLAAILPSTMPFELSPFLVGGCSALFIVVSIIGSLLSLYRVTKVDAIDAIGRAA
ncbi:ABC transporter permease [Priestia koreensis]|uniref:ABC transporter permease n=1 Tax=Priestia koreensis TaxID=284581 RepID=UPI0028F727BA|nr:ABC transporter permease [Priestia koreensis]